VASSSLNIITECDFSNIPGVAVCHIIQKVCTMMSTSYKLFESAFCGRSSMLHARLRKATQDQIPTALSVSVGHFTVCVHMRALRLLQQTIV
jgi:hypothetical protein